MTTAPVKTKLPAKTKPPTKTPVPGDTGSATTLVGRGIKAREAGSLDDRPTPEVADERTIACVEILVTTEDRSTASSATCLPGPSTLALQERLIHLVRPGDAVCPASINRALVSFGGTGSSLLPQVLGERLARSLDSATPLLAGHDTLVAIGISSHDHPSHGSEQARLAMVAARTSRRQLGEVWTTGSPSPTAIVTVDRPLAGRPPAAEGPGTPVRLHRRSVHRYVEGQRRGRPTPLNTGPQVDRPKGRRRPKATTNPVRSGPPAVLVIDLATPGDREPGLAAGALGAMVAQAGCQAAVTHFSPDDVLALAIDGRGLTLVVLVLEGGSIGQSSLWSSSAWGVASQLSATYRAAGVTVVAVSAGAGAGALAACTAKGAIPVFRMDQLEDLLALVARGGSVDPDQHLPIDAPLFQALVALTVSERRVLFYMTEGWSAQEVADELVVSLTTVRSHIRSVLRKLGVKSQLAAVAIANSRYLHEAGPRSEDPGA